MYCICRLCALRHRGRCCRIGFLSGIKIYLQVNGDLLNMSDDFWQTIWQMWGMFCTEGLVWAWKDSCSWEGSFWQRWGLKRRKLESTSYAFKWLYTMYKRTAVQHKAGIPKAKQTFKQLPLQTELLYHTHTQSTQMSSAHVRSIQHKSSSSAVPNTSTFKQWRPKSLS